MAPCQMTAWCGPAAIEEQDRTPAPNGRNVWARKTDGTTNLNAREMWPLRMPDTLRVPRSKDWG